MQIAVAGGDKVDAFGCVVGSEEVFDFGGVAVRPQLADMVIVGVPFRHLPVLGYFEYGLSAVVAAVVDERLVYYTKYA